MQLSNDHKEIFKNQGIVHVPGLISKNLTRHAKSALLKEMERLKLRTGGKISAHKLQSLPLFQQTTSLSQMIKMGAELDALYTVELRGMMNSLVPFRLMPSAAKPQLLISLPHKKDWSLNGLNWHLDLSVPHENQIPGIQVFILIDDLAPQGGATLALAGSHQLHAQDALRQNEVFRQLFEHTVLEPKKFFNPSRVAGVDVFIVEMCGKAGDVFFMDLRVLHSPSINATKNIRMMTTNRFLVK